jgi:hypothetical protein
MNAGYILRSRLSRAVGLLLVVLVVSWQLYAQTGCQTGAPALADAYIRLNPMYAYFFGDLESYVEENAEHFGVNGDAVRCAKALSQALQNEALQSFNPNEVRETMDRKQALDAQLGLMGINPDPSPAEPTLSSTLYDLSMRMSRLARILPLTADGDLDSLQNPANELERMQIVAEQILKNMFGDPTLQFVFNQMEPKIKQSAIAEWSMVKKLGYALATRTNNR